MNGPQTCNDIREQLPMLLYGELSFDEEESVESHLDGLRTSNDVGLRYCKKNLENLGPGEVFAVSILAFGTGTGAA